MSNYSLTFLIRPLIRRRFRRFIVVPDDAPCFTHTLGRTRLDGLYWIKCPVKRDDVFVLDGTRGNALVIASCTLHGTTLENLMFNGFSNKGACIQPRGSDLPNVYTTTGVYESRATKFLRWSVMFVGPQYGTCVMLPCRRLEFLGGSLIFWKIVEHCTKTS